MTVQEEAGRAFIRGLAAGFGGGVMLGAGVMLSGEHWAAYALIAGGFLLQLLGQFILRPSWVRR